MSLTLKVNIDDDQVAFLKEQGYYLFLAKLVQGQSQANVIWESNSAYVANNEFAWRPVYAIAGSETVEPGIQVVGSTGQPFTFSNMDADTDFAAAVYTGDPSNPTANLSNPFFISKSLEQNFSVDILPIETVVLWFGEAQKTSTIIAEYSGPALTAVYGEGDSNHTAQWTKKGWELIN
ncbi:hypothetical protein E1B28_007941 [Marasmius oreades]|uniref:Uncharacterized protein n=1 Tax=Marasmius oreades TaxID=181124 RepID=A0A9P7S424_9AGAR|nr:uncharacterized protein E1B28_007941 [Marasmius oreades]KAG7094341.1 hypothetical protein E1B28_007941 [Marasmius oreades]